MAKGFVMVLSNLHRSILCSVPQMLGDTEAREDSQREQEAGEGKVTVFLFASSCPGRGTKEELGKGWQGQSSLQTATVGEKP